jgi:drug/metabolite transporter (DMT)-like permease
MRFDYGQGKRHRNGSVNSIAAVPEHLNTRRSGIGMGRTDHPRHRVMHGSLHGRQDALSVCYNAPGFIFLQWGPVTGSVALMSTRLKSGLGWLSPAPLLAVVLWGGIYPGAKLGLQEIPVLSFTYVRLLLASLVLFAVARQVRPWQSVGTLWKPLMRAGLAQAVFQILLIAGLRYTTASNSAILLAAAPLITAAWLAATGREYLQRWQWGGLVVGFGGVSLVVQGGSVAFAWPQLGGDLLALGAAGAWAWYGLVIGPLVGALGTLRATGWTMGLAALLFTPLALLEVSGQEWGHVSWVAWAGLVYTATAGMVVAMALWGRAIHRLGPQQTMIYVYLEPVSALAIAALVLGEALGVLQAVGAGLTFVGVWLASKA